jgi:hypothetical protein
MSTAGAIRKLNPGSSSISPLDPTRMPPRAPLRRPRTEI